MSVKRTPYNMKRQSTNCTNYTKLGNSACFRLLRLQFVNFV